MLEYLTLIFLIETLFFLGIGIRVLAAQRPFVLNARWLLGFIVIAFSPMVIISLNRYSKSENSILLINILTFLVVTLFLAITMKGYVIIGVTDESFRKATYTVLRQLNIAFEEILGHIRLTSHNLELQAAVQSWTGTAQLKVRQPNGKSVLDKLARGIVAYYQSHGSKINPIAPIFYIFIGLLMLALAIFFMRL